MASIRFKPEKPRFFKIIFPWNIRNGKLGVPQRFSSKYGNELSSEVILKVPSGAIWKVGLVKYGKGVWLQNGWPEFLDYYSLAYGSLLVFEYQGNSDFLVSIFDKSALEIDYPFSESGCEKANFLQEKLKEIQIQGSGDVHVPGKFFNDHFPFVRTREEPPLSCPWSAKKMRTGESEGNSTFGAPIQDDGPQSGCFKVESLIGNIIPPSPGKEFQDKSGDEAVSGQKQKLHAANVRTEPLTADEKAAALDKAHAAFKSENPFFMVLIQPSYLIPGYGMIRVYPSSLPRHISRKGMVRLFCRILMEELGLLIM